MLIDGIHYVYINFSIYTIVSHLFAIYDAQEANSGLRSRDCRR